MTLIELAALFEERKSWLVTTDDLSKDALHIYFGLALFVTVRLIWRRRGGWLVAWLAVLAMACGGEFLDMTAEANRAAIQPDAAHWHDIWNTLFWPTVLLIVGRWLQPAARADAPAPNALSGENAERGLEQA
ncbi:hypothetical protein [Sphingopyxis witflariensis]|uniref:Uncharacterized protein n=1 Tax=Sphingopyxis witflariensis TaxID=173675 RepID=A0A246JD62_9SPHN|nr:hypothetical protein [Sphingopyxis witflariensis]OWQ90585.1 hypothetical protein CDQ91_20280 [Sphingopyxis witflariensis]